VRATPFGRYLLLEELAQGGMARVYRAVLRESSGFEKQVALKRMLQQLSADPEFVARFADEARIASTLNHANIAQVFDFGQVEGEYYIAMELVDGPDLGTLLEACREQRQPVPILAAVYVGAEAARGLGAAHGRIEDRGVAAPVIHRDISPQNILISRAGAVKVVDFGIAKAANKAARTRAGTIMGKCRYMSPEQAAAGTVTAAADVFSLGCVLFEALAMRPLFDGSSAREILDRIRTAPIPSVLSANPEVPPELDEILRRALARAPVERFPDGSALARELEALLHRMAPEYSCDDFGGFVCGMVPPPPRGNGLDAAATLPQAEAETQPPAPPTPAPAPAPDDALHAATTRVKPTAAPTPARTGRRLVLLGLAGLLGLLGGGAARLWPGSSGAPVAERRLTAGATLRHHGRSLELLQADRRGGKLHLVLATGGEARTSGAHFALLHGGSVSPPLYWSERSRAKLHLVFALPGGAPALVRFAPPDAPAIVLEVR
jgi:tRNA A-37 threonylcarbamoyl transferase component Bud32